MSDTVKLTGILTDIFPIETFTNFAKRAFWVKQPDTERYPQHWEFELHQGDTGRLKGIEIGDVVECEIEVRGKKYIKRDRSEGIITTLRCVGIKVTGKLGSAPGYKAIQKPGRANPTDTAGQPELPL